MATTCRTLECYREELRQEGTTMTLDEILDQAIALLQRRGVPVRWRPLRLRLAAGAPPRLPLWPGPLTVAQMAAIVAKRCSRRASSAGHASPRRLPSTASSASSC